MSEPQHQAESVERGLVLDRLWSDELCVWHINYHGSYMGEAVTPWVCILEWTQEGHNPHGADWATYTWQFYGDTADEAVDGAIAWCEALAPLRRCAECDGEGAWRGVECVACLGTGLDEPNTWGGEASDV